MNNPFYELCRHAGAFVVIVAVLLGLVFADVVAFLNHSQSLQSAFQLAGNDTDAIGNDPVWSHYLGAFARDANASHTLAIVFSVVLVAVGYMVGSCIHFFLDHAESMAHHGQVSQALPDTAIQEREMAHRAIRSSRIKIITRAVELIFVLMIAVPVIWYDVKINQFRLLAGARQTADAAQAAAISDPANGGDSSFLFALAPSGALASLCALVFVSAAAEFACRRLRERFALLVHATTVIWSTIASPGLDSPLRVTPSSAIVREPTATALAEPSTASGLPQATSTVAAAPAESESPPPLPPNEVPSTVESTARPVIGGAPGETVMLEEARRNPRYLVDDATGEIWLAQHRQELNDV